MTRPDDWSSLLMDGNPVPGNAHAVSDEGTRLSGIAATIEQQVAILNRMGGDTADLVGQTADKLRSSAAGLAGKLSKAQERYQKVSGYVTGWSTDLAALQKRVDDIHPDAVDAHTRLVASLPAGYDLTQLLFRILTLGEAVPAYPSGTTPSTAQQGAYKRAAEDLAGAYRRVRGVVSDRDSAAGGWKKKINGVIDHDAVHDSTWDGFKDWVDRNARWLNDLANVIGWVATALALVAIFVCSGPLGWIVFGLAIAALVPHTVLALAGDGTWLSVGLDVVSIATFGVGKVAGTAVEETVTATRTALAAKATSTIGGALSKASPEELAAAMDALDGALGNAPRTAEGFLNQLVRLNQTLKPLADLVAPVTDEAGALKALSQTKFSSGFLSTVWRGSSEAGGIADWIPKAADGLPGITGTIKGFPGVLGKLSTVSNAYRIAEAADLTNQSAGTAGEYFGWTGQSNLWDDLQTATTVAAGSAW